VRLGNGIVVVRGGVAVCKSLPESQVMGDVPAGIVSVIVRALLPSRAGFFDVRRLFLVRGGQLLLVFLQVGVDADFDVVQNKEDGVSARHDVLQRVVEFGQVDGLLRQLGCSRS